MSRSRWTQWIVLGSVFVLDATVAYSRIGVRENYSSGGGSSTSSYSPNSSNYSGGSGGGEFATFDLIVCFAAIVFSIYCARMRSEERKALAARRRRTSQARAELLKERDEKFDVDVFQARVERAFLEIQKAWSSQDLRTVRGFISDGLHERFSTRFREQQALGYVHRMSRVRVEGLCLVGLRREAHLDIVSVQIWARTLDTRVGLETGREIEGSRRHERFSEIWSFVRGSDVQSSNAAGLFEGRCPNCSAPIDPKQAWACDPCGGAIDAAPPDWVLAGITQSSEWSIPYASEPEWLKQAVERDPGLTVQQLEDRACVLFWRLADSNRTLTRWRLESVGRTTFLEEQARRIAAHPDRRTMNCAVGSINLRGIIPGREFDRVLMEIRWSANLVEGSEETAPPFPVANRSLLVMARRASIQSQRGRCVASAHCSKCGAPDEGALGGACPFCGEVLNDGRDWLMEDFLRIDESEAVILLEEVGR